MTFLATTKVALLRGTMLDHGDEVDDNRIPDALVTLPGNKTATPASLIQKSKNVQDPSSGTWRKVSYMRCQLSPTTPVQDGDRIIDLRTFIIYSITDSTAVPRSLAGQASLTLDLTASS